VTIANSVDKRFASRIAADLRECAEIDAAVDEVAAVLVFGTNEREKTRDGLRKLADALDFGVDTEGDPP
jgi:hypothetical protein